MIDQKRTRLEAFTDAAFAFAMTLLAIGGDHAPASVSELRLSLHYIPAFLASAALLLMFWYKHMRWSRELDTGRPLAVILTMTLVCTVLVYMYPLRLVFGGLFYWISGGALAAGFTVQTQSELSLLFVVYSVGFLVMCLCLAALYAHSARHADALALTAEQRVDARAEALGLLCLSSPALLVISAATLLPPRGQAYAMLGYGLLAVVMPWFARWHHRTRAQRVARESALLAGLA